MKFIEVVDEIRKITEIRVLSSMSDSEISKIKLWGNNAESEIDTVLFFGYDEQKENLPTHYIMSADWTDGQPMVPFAHEADVRLSPYAALTEKGQPSDSSSPEAEEHPAAPLKNIAVIHKDQFACVFNYIQDILTERTSSDYRRYLLKSADTVHSVDALIDIASETFNASLVLIDRDYRIISYSTKVPVTDNLWSENIRKGYCDYEFISEVKKLKSVQMANPGMTPFEVTCSASPYRKYACRVYCKEVWVASLLLIEGHQTYKPEHVEMLRMLSSVTGYSLLAHSPELLSRTSDYQSFLYNLLIGTPIENLPEPYRAMEFQKDMELLYFRSQSRIALPIKGKALEEAFHMELPDCHVITYRKATLVICDLKMQKNIDHLLTLFPEEQEVSVGISKPIHKIENLHSALKEARDALTVGKSIAPERRIFSFEEFSTFIMLKHLSESEDIRLYLHPAVPVLLNYDQKYGTKLLSTLKTYLLSSCNIKDTSEALYLHRNSVIYRLHKAEEISGLDLNDPNTRFSLLMSFHILRISSEAPSKQTL